MNSRTTTRILAFWGLDETTLSGIIIATCVLGFVAFAFLILVRCSGLRQNREKGKGAGWIWREKERDGQMGGRREMRGQERGERGKKSGG